MLMDLAGVTADGIVTRDSLRIYTGISGQIGDIIAFTATARRIKQLFPNSSLTFAVAQKYREAGELVQGLPFVDKLFVSELYFEKLTDLVYNAWHLGWPVDLRGDDEIEEQRGYDLVFETRPRHRHMPWWQYCHFTEEQAHMIGVPGPVDPKTEICIPSSTRVPAAALGKYVIHNEPNIDDRKGWPWENVRQVVNVIGEEEVVLIGGVGPTIPDVLDLRGQTTLAQSAQIIESAKCFIGIESGPIMIAGSLMVPTVGLFGTAYISAYTAIHPHNPNAIYLQTDGALDGITPNQVVDAVRRAVVKTRAG